MKTIVTHVHPDLDGIAAIWLLVRYGGVSEVQFAFVPAGATYRNELVDSDPDIIHVDTGLGRYDHHDPVRTHLSAARLVWEELKKNRAGLSQNQALERMVEHVTDVDQFGEYYWPEPSHPRWSFMLSEVIPGLHLAEKYTDAEVVEMALLYMDGVYAVLAEQIHAEMEVRQGEEFDSLWGRGIAIESGNDAVMKVAQKMGYMVVVRKDPQHGFLRIKAAPKPEIDLTALYDKIKTRDSESDWFFHPNRHMILNGSKHRPGDRATSLKIADIVKMIEEIK